MALRTGSVNGLAICAGVGAIELGLSLVIPGYRTVGVVEQEARLASVWVARMDAQIMDRAAIWDDLTTFDGRPWRGGVDIISGGIPCQPFSVAGQRRGLDDERWIWKDAARVIDEVQPRCVFIENVPGIVHAGLPEMLSDLAALGFDAEWGTLSASNVGAPHIRNRFWLLAYTRRGGAGWLQHVTRTSWGATDGGEDGERMADTGSDGHSRQWLRSVHRGRGSGFGTQSTGVTDRPSGTVADTQDGNGRVRETGERNDHFDHRGSSTQLADSENGGHQAGGGSVRNGTQLAVAASDGAELMADSDIDRRTAEGQYPERLFPPGPNDADGWREYIAQGGPEPVTWQEATQSGVLGSPHEPSDRLDRIHAAGNSVLPLAAAVAFRLLADRAIDRR